MDNVAAARSPTMLEASERLAAMSKEGAVGRIVAAVAVLAIAAALILLVILVNREQSRVLALKQANVKIEALTAEARRANDRAKMLLAGQEAATPRVARALHQISIADANLDAAANVTPSRPSTAIPASTAAVSPTKRDQVLSRGLASGWDIDVFWCANGAADANYATAARVANALSLTASNETAISEGVRLGQVRLRLAPPVLEQDWQGLGGVVFDNGKGEQEAATSLLNHIVTISGDRLRLVHSVGRLTPYYLSVKICALNA